MWLLSLENLTEVTPLVCAASSRRRHLPLIIFHLQCTPRLGINTWWWALLIGTSSCWFSLRNNPFTIVRHPCGCIHVGHGFKVGRFITINIFTFTNQIELFQSSNIVNSALTVASFCLYIRFRCTRQISKFDWSNDQTWNACYTQLDGCGLRLHEKIFLSHFETSTHTCK